MGSNSQGRSGQGGSERLPTDPVVFAVCENRTDDTAGVPYDRVIQVVRRRLGIERSEAVREIESLIEEGRLVRVRGDRLALPPA